MAKPRTYFPCIERLLLMCGVVASLLRVATDILSALRYPGYSYLDQTMSQLAAVGAPTRAFQIALLAVFDALVATFGVGVWRTAGKKRSLATAGILLVIFGVTGIIGLAFPQTAMQLSGGLAAQVVHIVVTALGVILIVLFIGFGAFALGTSFRIFSAAMVFIMLLFGVLAAAKAPLAVEFSYPWMGAMERICYYSHLLWILVFAIVLLRSALKSPRDIVPGKAR